MFPLIAYSTDVCGDVWGVWTAANSPFNVTCEVRVPPGQTLTIQPGCYINFLGHYKFIVDSMATLQAAGTPTDSIIFTAADTSAGWHGIRFLSASNSCQLAYCRIEYGKSNGNGDDASGGGIFCMNSGPTITHNSISNNLANDYGGGIYSDLSSNSSITSNIISNNSAGIDGGGICCNYSSPTISSNTIEGNSAARDGGAIDCQSSNPTINNNLLSGNSADRWGGGITLAISTATIADNAISGNSCGSNGGGIYCESSSPSISRNTLTGNSAHAGGGIYSYLSFSTVTENVIEGNLAVAAFATGGGIHCQHDTSTFERNIICNNSSDFQGAGVYCHLSETYLTNNTISDNSSIDGGAGFTCDQNSNATVLNTILWNNLAPHDPEIWLKVGSSASITYSDIAGGWSGTGNINADPLFVDPQNGDYHLQAGSPCINAGDPNPIYNDPDGTRNDMGALYFEPLQPPPCCDVAMMPDTYPIIVPQGGSFGLTGTIGNPTPDAIVTDVWVGIKFNGNFLQLWYFPNIYLLPNQYGSAHLNQLVPIYAVPGEYEYRAHCGDFTYWQVCDVDSFFFTVTAARSDNGAEEWDLEGGWGQDAETPSEYALSSNYPNPFNASTQIEFDLVKSGNVRVEVFNLLGQKVETLVDGHKNSGHHSITWDASNYSSGIYFYKLTAGDFTQTKRMTLLK